MSIETDTPKRRKRMDRAARERMIVEGAIGFFADEGLGGDMRALATRLGITQSLIYKFFDSKEALIERVYEEVFMTRWNPMWEEALEDRSVPLQQRLLRFYPAYADEVLNYEWIRLYLLAGLAGETFNRRYFDFVRERIFDRIIAEIRHEKGLPTPEEKPITETEIELLWMLHADVFYIGIRKWVYGMPVPDDIAGLVATKVDLFMNGAPGAIEKLFRTSA